MLPFLLGMDRKSKTLQLTQGAMLLAIYFAIILLDRVFAGTLVLTLLFVIPTPFIIYCLKNGKKGLIVVIISSIIGTLLFGYFTSIFYCITAEILGIFSGLCFYYKKKPWLTILGSIILSIIFAILSVTVLSGLAGINVETEILEIKEMVDKFMKPLYASYDMLDIYEMVLTDKLMIGVYRFTYVITGIVQGITNYLLTRVVQIKMNRVGRSIQ